MVYSAAVWAFDWAPPYENAIKAIAETGCKGVELRIHARGESDYTDARCESLRQLMQDEGLVLTNLNYTPEGASDVSADKRAQAVSDFHRVTELAKRLGAELVTVEASYPFDIKPMDEHYKPSMQIWSVPMPAGADFGQNYADYLDTLRAFAAICKEAGLQMAIETIPLSWARNTDAILRLLEKLDADHVGVSYDVANITMSGDLAEIFAYRLNKRILNVQMADNHGLNNAHWRPGKGKNDFNALVRALEDVGYQGPVCLELGDAKGAGRNPAAFYEPHGDYKTLIREHELAIMELDRIYGEERA